MSNAVKQMNECEIIANAIMQKLMRVSEKSGIPVETLLHTGLNIFEKNRRNCDV